MKKTYVLQLPVSITSYDEIIEEVKQKIKDNQKYSIISINLNKIILANENEEIMKIVKSFDCFIPDGISVVRASNELTDRITGVDLFEKICNEHEKINARIFLYGAKRDIVEETKKNLLEKYLGINIVGIEDGYIKNNEKLLEEINKSDANIVFIAMGSPKQEKWIYENKDKLKANVFMGVGGGFDVMSGKTKRAPKYIQKMGIEWLYRMLKEPKRFKNVPLQIKYFYKLKKERRNCK